MNNATKHTPLCLNVRAESGRYYLTFSDDGKIVHEFTADQKAVKIIRRENWYRGVDYPYTIKTNIGSITIHRFIGGVDKQNSYDMEFLNGDRNDISACNLRAVPHSYRIRNTDKDVKRTGKWATKDKQIHRTGDGCFYSQHSYQYAQITSIQTKTRSAAVMVRNYYSWFLEPEMHAYIPKPDITVELEAQILAVLPKRMEETRHCRKVPKPTPVPRIYLTNPGPNLRYEYRFMFKRKVYAEYGFVSITAAAKAHNRQVWELTADRHRFIRLPLATRLREKKRIMKLEEAGLLKDGQPVKKCSTTLAKRIAQGAKVTVGGIF